MIRFLTPLTTSFLLLLAAACVSGDSQLITFSRGKREYSFALGYGENHRIPRSMSIRFGFDTIRLRYGRYRCPRRQFAYEVCVGKQTKDMDSTMVSAIVSCRHYFARRDRMALGADVGVGFAILGDEVPGLSTTTNFTEMIGVSFQYVTGNASAITLDYRFCHISNAGLKLPNVGVNASALSIGYSWYK